MHILNERLQEVISYLLVNGEENTVKEFGLTHETLGRYKREYKIRINGDEEKLPPTPAPKVLVLDIETLPLVCYSWSLGKVHLNSEQVIRDWCVASWSAKWLNDKDVYGGALTPAEALERRDKRIMEDVWKFVEDCDVIIAHNGDNFDIVRLNTRFILNGLKPPLSYQSIDTLKLARRKFAFTSNKLDYISKLLSLEGKIKTEFELWRRVDVGDQQAIDRMLEYNKRDVTLLEEVYHVLGAWMPSHPNFGMMIDDNVSMCPHCMSMDLDWVGTYRTLVGEYATCRCNVCGFIGRSRITSLSKKKRESLITSIAR